MVVISQLVTSGLLTPVRFPEHSARSVKAWQAPTLCDNVLNETLEAENSLVYEHLIAFGRSVHIKAMSNRALEI
jgi:hypothetical protein